MPRGGDYMLATVELIAGNGSITVNVHTKNREDTGNGTAVSGSLSPSGVGRDTDEFTSLKELVRYEFVAGGTTSQWVLFRMLEPVWFDAVAV
ncbi:MAG: hypothetical protein H6828_10785 [Planctomycetes bacterium]|nr:hypothetical protein [Planctomycetota bacterium]